MERGFQRGSGKNRDAGQSLAKVKECWGVAKELDASIKHSGGIIKGGLDKGVGSVLTPEKSSRTPLDTINANHIPEWVIILAQKCDETSQSAVADAMGYSAALISTVLKNAYTGDLRRVEARVKDMYIRADVPCPVMGEITGAQCTQYQHRAVTGASSIFSRLRATCPNCKYRETA